MLRLPGTRPTLLALFIIALPGPFTGLPGHWKCAQAGAAYAAPNASSQPTPEHLIVVAKDGTGQFTTVQAAIDAVPAGSGERVVIAIRPGVYKEPITVPASKRFVTFRGDSPDAADRTVLTFERSARSLRPDGTPYGTAGSASVDLRASDFTADNITFQNTAGPGPLVGQAIAASVTGDRCVFRRCRFLGWQDTLYAADGRQYYGDCIIEGSVDFIFGNASAVFDHCAIRSLAAGCITAQSRTDPGAPNGFIFQHCRLTSTPEVPRASVSLGRPWRAYARALYLHCWMGDHIQAGGWTDWGKETERRKTVQYAEYEDTGPGAQPERRVPWSHQLTAAEANRFNRIQLLAGSDGWRSPLTKLPAVPQPVIPDKTFPVTEYGAVGDGKTMNTAALQKALDACHAAGGGTVVVPKGLFMTAPFHLYSSINLHLEPGAILLLSGNSALYALRGRGYENCITADDCHDVAITGGGTIDGNGSAWWDRYRKRKAPGSSVATEPDLPHRPFMVVLSRCTRVLVQDVSLVNSPSFHLVPDACQDVTIEDVQITAPPDAPNTDGIDPSGRNYLITRCHIDVGDDCIAVKPSHRYDPARPSCEDFTITDCAFLRGHGLSIGGQTPGGLQNMTVRDCTFEGTAAGIRMKANRGSGGLVEDVTYENLSMKNVKVAILITSYYPSIPKSPEKDEAQPVTATTPLWRHIRIRNVTAEGSASAGQLIGLPEAPIEDILLSNVKISAEKGMEVVHAKGIRFEHSEIRATMGNALQVYDSEVSGLDAGTGK